ncbi:hypothetical protein KSP40_PGU020753 [Platanthera guangdongensis]|uniref:HMA domain-containing protein n=1 Tax=Platanthera guangdongensis TaxID=2320717 RepID=A0ABR2LWZ1_9ASPA
MTGRMWSMLMVKVKERMGIVGLEVVPNRQVVLISLYKQTLTEIKAVLEEEGYRKAWRASPTTPSGLASMALGLMAF